jgi:hypothetical protein
MLAVVFRYLIFRDISQNFVACLPVKHDNTKMLVDCATDRGFTFYELRDPEEVLTFGECIDIASYPREKGIEVAYANQRGLLDPDFWSVFKKGIKNATAFYGAKTIRALISGLNFSKYPGKTGLSHDEFTKIVDIANQAALIAKEQ